MSGILSKQEINEYLTEIVKIYNKNS